MLDKVKRFFTLESSSGIVLFIAALLAMVWANSSLAPLQHRFIENYLFLINEGLMAFFFLVVGLELKRGFLEGGLSSLSQIGLPAIAALGGMIVPAAIYILLNYHHPATLNAWATPVATDIAFALGALSLFGKRVPSTLKLFLLTLAIFDDIGAIVVIAVFYSHKISCLWLIGAALLMLVAYGLNKLAIQRLGPYLAIGLLLWLFLLHSGVHPTITGVLIALMIPAGTQRKTSPLHRLETKLHPWVAYLIMPLFALANAGFSLKGVTAATFSHEMTLGIILGLFFGKQIGVFGFTWLMVQTRLVSLPARTNWFELYGVAILCGIGFTMSLFLGTLSFENVQTYLTEVRLGVLMGSLLSGIVGVLVLNLAFNRNKY